MPDKDATKDVLRMFTYGLFVATSMSPEGPRAATLSWVTQTSFEPRLIAAAIRKGTAIHEAIVTGRRFALHIVGADQPDFAKAFFRVSRSGPADIAGHSFTLSEAGVPIFDAAPAWLECEIIEEVNQLGDHTVFIAKVIGSGLRISGAPALALRDTPWHYGG